MKPTPATKPFRAVWLQKLAAWLRRIKLEQELRSSRSFQKWCREIDCFTLAEVEELHQTKIKEQIRRLP